VEKVGKRLLLSSKVDLIGATRGVRIIWDLALASVLCEPCDCCNHSNAQQFRSATPKISSSSARAQRCTSRRKPFLWRRGSKQSGMDVL